MRAIIFIYSNTGNTKLACDYLARKIPSVQWDFCDIKKCHDKIPDNYQLCGFASYTDAWDVPPYFKEYFTHLKKVNNIPAFVLNTFGFTSGRTLINLARLASEKGFQIIGGHSLHMPENYPPMISLGLGNKNAPNKKALLKFNEFINWLSITANDIDQEKEIIPKKIDIGLNKILPRYPQSMIHGMIGEKKVNKDKCKKCGVCARSCPYKNIKLDPYPVFGQTKCSYCWACYNLCPQQAIYTTKYKKTRYSRPNEALKEKFN
ncbi:MAG: EFR1 family ferrodoxin [Patescibacteria group bacterium]|jgi:ferredoxin/flavodoxin